MKIARCGSNPGSPKRITIASVEFMSDVVAYVHVCEGGKWKFDYGIDGQKILARSVKHTPPLTSHPLGWLVECDGVNIQESGSTS